MQIADGKGLDIPEEDLKEVCRSYSVRRLSVFGSILSDKFTPQSDVDVLVDFQPDAKIGLFAFEGLREELADLVNRDVDLVSERGLNPMIQAEILEKRRILYEA